MLLIYLLLLIYIYILLVSQAFERKDSHTSSYDRKSRKKIGDEKSSSIGEDLVTVDAIGVFEGDSRSPDRKRRKHSKSPSRSNSRERDRRGRDADKRKVCF